MEYKELINKADSWFSNYAKAKLRFDFVHFLDDMALIIQINNFYDGGWGRFVEDNEISE